jgi:hypothetical protein
LHSPISGPEGTEYQSIKKAIQYGGDAFWSIPGRPVEDLRKTAWVEESEPSEGTRMTLGPTSNPARDRVRILRESASRIEIAADLESDGFLVLAESYDPGWSLRIDDRVASVRRTNLAMRGCYVPKGSHQLVFSYEPRTYRLGLILSAVGGLALAVMIFAPIIGRGRTRHG